VETLKQEGIVQEKMNKDILETLTALDLMTRMESLGISAFMEGPLPTVSGSQ
jgi:hypothetical protein